MKIFIAGARAIKDLPKAVEERLANIQKLNYSVLIGDADGVDKTVQDYFSNNHYPNVTVYSSNGKVRNNVGKWQIQAVSVANNVKGFDFYAAKDKQMALDADYGFMIWNGKSRGTYNNIINLINQQKTSLVFLTSICNFVVIKSEDDLKESLSLYKQRNQNEVYEQMKMF